MFTDPNRLRETDPRIVENNPLWIFHDAFKPDQELLIEAKQRYCAGKTGDVECKRRLIDVLLELLNPMRKRRSEYEKDPAAIQQILQEGARRVNSIAEETIAREKTQVNQRYAESNTSF